MNVPQLVTKHLILKAQTRDEIRASIERLEPQERASVSPDWLALLEKSGAMDPWIHGFVVLHRESGGVVGKCGFTGPPDAGDAVEIAYAIEPEYQGRGYATEAAEVLLDFAFSHESVGLVRAHTLREMKASTRVLTKCGFQQVGEVVDPNDGCVWRWEIRREIRAATRAAGRSDDGGLSGIGGDSPVRLA